MEYIKFTHVLTAILSLGGFIARGVFLILESPLLKARRVKILPHINDTLLFAMGITLMVQTQQYPTTQTWLAVKLLLLVAYIGLGMVAFRFGRTKTVRITAWLCAIVVFFYIIGLALTHRVLLFI